MGWGVLSWQDAGSVFLEAAVQAPRAWREIPNAEGTRQACLSGGVKDATGLKMLR